MVKNSACLLFMWTLSFLVMMGWNYMYVTSAAADNGQVPVGLECKWKVFYSMEQVIHEKGLQLYFKTSSDSCESQLVSLELFQAKWSNLTKCLHKDDLLGIAFNKTEDHNFWYTNLEPGNYCILIKPLARACSECYPSFTALVTLFPSQYSEANQTSTKRASALGNLNATSLYIAIGGVLLISATAFLLFILKRSKRIPQQDENPKDSSKNGSYECTCGIREALLETKVFILHTRDAWRRSIALCQKLNEVLPVTALYKELYTRPLEWIADRIKHKHVKIVVVESRGAVQIRLNQLEKSGIPAEPENFHLQENGPSHPDSVLDLMDLTFLNGLSGIMKDPRLCFEGYKRVFVVRFPNTPRDLKIAKLMEDVRYTLPKHFPDLCQCLLEMRCRKCLKEKYHEWKTISNDREFWGNFSREGPAQ